MSNKIYEKVNDEIIEYVDNKQSFFLMAGAGSGKTGSLKIMLLAMKEKYKGQLLPNGRMIKVITYTNAATEEIKSRVNYDEFFDISTIHSFAWDLIKSFQNDIRSTLICICKEKIEEESKKTKKDGSPKKGVTEKIEKYNSRIERYSQVRYFQYSPDGNNNRKGFIQHGDVINIFSKFLDKPYFVSIMVSKYPYLFIDECQDTNKNILPKLINIANECGGRFCVGLFGDTMQRIYADGVDDLSSLISGWKTPPKEYNFRSSSRVVKLANDLRKDWSDGIFQKEHPNAENGVVKLFIKDNRSAKNKDHIENLVSQNMYNSTLDKEWNENHYKTLILEHKMAAIRGGFDKFYFALAESSLVAEGITNGERLSPEIKFMLKDIHVLYKAIEQDNKYALMNYILNNTMLLDSLSNKQGEVNDYLHDLKSKLPKVNSNIKIYDFLRQLNSNGIITFDSRIDVHEFFKDVLCLNVQDVGEIDEDNKGLQKQQAWRNALEADLSELEKYHNYILDDSRFGTHQGVKGLEYDNVMLILDDLSARGFLFKYEKLFGVEMETSVDIRNKELGKDHSISRVLRLFYVGCTRARKNLAVVTYTKSPELLRDHVIRKKWFSEEEICIL